MGLGFPSKHSCESGWKEVGEFGFQGNPGVSDAPKVEIIDGTNQPIAPADLKRRFVNIRSNPTGGLVVIHDDPFHRAGEKIAETN